MLSAVAQRRARIREKQLRVRKLLAEFQAAKTDTLQKALPAAEQQIEENDSSIKTADQANQASQIDTNDKTIHLARCLPRRAMSGSKRKQNSLVFH